MIIFDTKKQYNNLIENGFAKYPNSRDLFILGNEWKTQNIVKSKQELKTHLISFCLKWNIDFNEIMCENMLINICDKIFCDDVRNSVRNDTQKTAKSISFTAKELDFIQTKLNENIKAQKVLFIIMCLAKRKNIDYIYFNSTSTIKLSYVFKLANITATGVQQLQILHFICECGGLECLLKPIGKFIIKFIDSDKEDIALSFILRDTMISEYEKKCLGVNYFVCEICGGDFIRTNAKQRRCNACGQEINRQKTRERKRKV